MFSKVGTFGVAGVALMAFAGFALAILPSSWAQSPRIPGTNGPGAAEILGRSTNYMLSHTDSIEKLDTFTKLMQYRSVSPNRLMSDLTARIPAKFLAPPDISITNKVPPSEVRPEGCIFTKIGGPPDPSLSDCVFPDPWYLLE